MYTTCVIWLAFAAVYFAIDVKVFSLCVATNASAYVVLIFLFFPKLYLIIFKPEKNHRRYAKKKESFFLISIFLAVHLQQIRIFVVILVHLQHQKAIYHPIVIVKVHHYFVVRFYIEFVLEIHYV